MDLDDLELMRGIDRSNMYGLLQAFGDQLVEGRERAAGLMPGGREAGGRLIVVAGMGGSAVCGDILAGVLRQELRMPLMVTRSYDLPVFAGRGSTVIAVSYSGNTEETLSAAEDAVAGGASVVGITSGGMLKDFLERRGMPVVAIPGGMPPRGALGYLLGALGMILERLGAVGSLENAFQEARGVACDMARELAMDTKSGANAAKKLAAALDGKFAMIYGTVPLLEGIVIRWRTQLNENAKVLAGTHMFPELDHNEIVGWGGPARLRELAEVVILRDREEGERIVRRVAITNRIIGPYTSCIHEEASRGDSRLARAISLIVLGDFVSFYLAMLGGVDPTPVDRIEKLKQELKSKGGLERCRTDTSSLPSP